MHSVDIVVISVNSPLKIGVYKDNLLIKQIIKDGKSSDLLPSIFRDIFKKYKIKRIFYTKGPGSYMSIKIAYVFLKTICLLKKIELYASDAFLFNNNSAIKSIGKSFFIKEKNSIIVKKIDNPIVDDFMLPKNIDFKNFTKDTKPMYIIPAV